MVTKVEKYFATTLGSLGQVATWTLHVYLKFSQPVLRFHQYRPGSMSSEESISTMGTYRFEKTLLLTWTATFTHLTQRIQLKKRRQSFKGSCLQIG